MTAGWLVLALAGLSVALYVFRGLRSLRRAQREWEAHVQQAVDIIDGDPR